MQRTESVLAALREGHSNRDVLESLEDAPLTPDELEQLLRQARELEDARLAYQVLMLIYSAAQDEWFRLRVLGYAAAHPGVTLSTRQNTLRSMERLLDQMTQLLEQDDQGDEQAAWLRLFGAGYELLVGQVNEQAGQAEESLAAYEGAAETYRELGYLPAAQRVERRLKRLQPAPAPAPSPQPSSTASVPAQPPPPAQPPVAESLRAERDVLVNKLNQQQQQLDALRQERDRLQSDLQTARRQSQPQAQPQPQRPTVDNREALQRQIQALQTQLKSEQEQRRRLEQQARQTARPERQAEVEQKLSELQDQVIAAQEDEERLQQRILQKQASLEKLEQLSAQKDHLLQEVADLKQRVREMRHELEALQAQKEELEDDLRHQRRTPKP